MDRRELHQPLATRNVRDFADFTERLGLALITTDARATARPQVVGRADRTKDADNLVKGLLDALQGSPFPNDRTIAHLAVHRFRHAGDEGHYLVNIRPVRDPLEDVVDPEVRIDWLGRPEIVV